MAKESWISGEDDVQPDPGVVTSLDELAKGLASGTTCRGKVLRWMGGALVGAAVASVPGLAWAAPGGNAPAHSSVNSSPLEGMLQLWREEETSGKSIDNRRR